MTRVLRILAIAACTSVPAANALSGPGLYGESWRDSESVAFTDARASGRHVLVVFGADWCLPCRRIERIMNDESVFGLLSESFVPLHFDITELSEQDEALQAKYRAPTLPAVIFVDTNGRELGRWNRESAETFTAEMERILASYPRPTPQPPTGSAEIEELSSSPSESRGIEMSVSFPRKPLLSVQEVP
jgi:thiol:disulfide interchange protein